MNIFIGSKYYLSIILFIPFVVIIIGEILPAWVLVGLFLTQMIMFILYVIEGLR